MGARRRIERAVEVEAPRSTTRSVPALTLAGAEAAAAVSPVHEHLARLEASFAADPGPAPYPPAVRLAIMVGAPAALWGLVIVGVGAFARAVGA